MSKHKTNLLLVVMASIAVLTAGLWTDTNRSPWMPLRTAVTVDNTALDGTTASYTFAFSDKPSTAKEIETQWNGIDVYFYGTDAANETCNYKIYVWKANGPACLWCSGVFALGAAVTGGTTTYYADTITVTNVHGNAGVKDGSGNDRIAVLRLGDMRGYRYIFCEIDIPASTQVASASAEMTGY